MENSEENTHVGTLANTNVAFSNAHYNTFEIEIKKN